MRERYEIWDCICINLGNFINIPFWHHRKVLRLVIFIILETV